MPSYRMVYGNDVILRVQDVHIQSLEVLGEVGPGEPSWQPV